MKTGQWDSGRFRTGKKEKKAKRGGERGDTRLSRCCSLLRANTDKIVFSEVQRQSMGL